MCCINLNACYIRNLNEFKNLMEFTPWSRYVPYRIPDVKLNTCPKRTQGNTEPLSTLSNYPNSTSLQTNRAYTIASIAA